MSGSRVPDVVFDLAVRYGFEVLGAIVILVAGLVAARWIAKLVDQRLAKQAMEPPLRILIVRVVKVLVMLFAALVALDKFGFQIAPLVAGIGVAGVGVGLALQGVLGNLMAGLTIIFTKPFRVGEYVSLLGVHGAVAQVELFSTVLVHPDRSRVVIPNRRIVGEILHNYGRSRQLKILVSLPLDADAARALAVARDVVARSPWALKEPAPIVGVDAVTEGVIRIAVLPWVPVAEEIVAGSELHEALVAALRAHGVPLGVTPTYVQLLNQPGG
jgi:small conductance mechanosensitive channel